jgi:hypothetical protein
VSAFGVGEMGKNRRGLFGLAAVSYQNRHTASADWSLPLRTAVLARPSLRDASADVDIVLSTVRLIVPQSGCNPLISGGPRVIPMISAVRTRKARVAIAGSSLRGMSVRREFTPACMSFGSASRRVRVDVCRTSAVSTQRCRAILE